MHILSSAAVIINDIASGIAVVAMIALIIVLVKVMGKPGSMGISLLFGILVGVIAIGPIIFCNEEMKDYFPTTAFPIKFWIVFVLMTTAAIMTNMLGSREKGKLRWLINAGCVIVSLICASWVAQTMEAMSFVFHNKDISFIGKMFYELVGAIYFIVYFFAPVFLLMFLFDSGKTVFDKKAPKK